MVQLPRFAALKSKYNDNYLRYINETCSPVRSFLQYSGKDILSPFTKFEFEQARCDPSLFHIKCCYNNKYWVSWACDHHFIVAGADHKEEDRYKWTCTLFRPVYESCHQSYRFCHVRLGFNVVLWRGGPPFGECLRAQWSDPDRDLCDLSIVINRESIWSLPKYIAFKSDNGSYLSARLISQLPYLQFSSKSIDDPSIQMETFITNDGKIHIKSIFFQKFWKRGTSNWIFADSTDDSSENLDTLFSPTQVSSTVVALRNLGNGNFVKRYSLASKANFLNAGAKEIDSFSHLQMVEPILSREISNVMFYLSEARIYDEAVIVLATKEVTNNFHVPSTLCIPFSYTNTRYSKWASSISMKLDVKTTIDSGVPLIVNRKKIETLSTKFSGEYKWGETITISKTKEIKYEVTVPPTSTSIVTLYATKGSCDVPFSYKQVDILIGGKEVESYLADGIYHGTNYYNLKYEVKTKQICGCPNED
ncbi:hypothetical protein SDJN03_12458, partial [Cucurbita argyrosperma subsp. sororia]